MGQFMGILALLLSETPVLQLNVTRYTIALRQAMSNLQPNNIAVLSIKELISLSNEKIESFLSDPLRNAIDDFDKVAQDFVARSKSMDAEK